MNTTNREIEIILEAIEKDNPDPILELYKNGFNIHKKFPDGESILHKCFARRKYTVAQHMILLGCDLNSTDNNGRTALHFAARYGFYEGSNLLVLLGCNIDPLDHKERTPLMHAIKYKQMIVVKQLMNKGSDCDIEDGNGFSALLWAVKHFNADDLKEMLQASKSEIIAKQLDSQLEIISQRKSTDLLICDELQSALREDGTDKSNFDLDKENSVNYLKEAISNSRNVIENSFTYSIVEHLASLKEKNTQEEFDYERKIISDHDEKSNSSEIEYSISPEKKEKIETLEKVQEQNEAPKQIVSNVSNTTQEKALRESRPQNLEAPPKEFKDKEIKKSAPNSTAPTIDDPIQKEQISSKVEPIKEERAEQIVKIQKNEEVENIDKSPNKTSLPTDSKEYQTKSSSPITREMEKEYVARVKGDSSLEENNEDKHIYKIAGDKQDLAAQANEALEIKRILSESTEEQIANVPKKTLIESDKEKEDFTIHKKNITYLRDGYKEVYKEDYGQIKSVNKELDDDILGTLKSTDRVFKDELGAIKTTNKNIEGNIETSFVRGGKSINFTGSPEKTKTSTIKNNSDVETDGNSEIMRIKRISNAAEQVSSDASITSVSVKSTTPSKEIPQLKPRENFLTETEKKISSKDFSSDKVTSEIKEVKESIDNSNTEQIAPTVQDEISEKDQPKEVITPLTPEEVKTLNSVVDANQRNSKGQTLCWLASEQGQINLLKKLIHDGADYEIKDPKGISCLMIASINGRKEIVEYLSHKVRNVDEKNSEGHTALIFAIENDRADIAKILLDNGASIETKIKGNNLLMHAAQAGALTSIKLLILQGLDPLEKNFRGKTALDLSKLSKNKKAHLMLSKIIESKSRATKGS